MATDSTIGIYGKLPAHGDFIHRNLPSRVINEWDKWLQTFVGSTQERMGDRWLDLYLTSPIWRFCLSSGVFDDNQWAGIVLPSVDRVGRYFPFSVLAKLPTHNAPCEFMATQQAWFESLENLALSALDGQLQVDPMVAALNKQSTLAKNLFQRQNAININAGLVIDMSYQDPSALGTMPHHLDAFVASAFNSYSIWSTMGSEQVEPCSFITSGMPPVAGASAMLDGLWEHWEWSVPVRPIDQQPTVFSPQVEPIDDNESDGLGVSDTDDNPSDGEDTDIDSTLRPNDRYNL